MLLTALNLGPIAAAWFAFTSPAVQQPPPTQPPGQPPGTAVRQDPSTAAPMPLRAKQIIGSKVNLTGNVTAGTVDDIVLTDDGQVEYVLVIQDGKLVTVPWAAVKFNFEQRVAVINLTQEQYRTIPTYTVQTYPQFFAPAYRTEIYKFYNLTPREIRRIERRNR
jgi:hypothetical protein